MFNQTLPQKGVTLFPHTNKNPPMVRFRGADINTPEGAAILYEILPTAKRYYTQQAHLFSLSIITQQKTKIRTVAGDEIQVIFSSGQEYVNILAVPRVGGESVAGLPGIVCVPQDASAAVYGWGTPYTEGNRPLGTPAPDATYGNSPFVIIPYANNVVKPLVKEDTEHTHAPDSSASAQAYGTLGAWANRQVAVSWTENNVYADGLVVLVGTSRFEILHAAVVGGQVYAVAQDNDLNATSVLTGFPERLVGDDHASVEGTDFAVIATYTEVNATTDRGKVTVSPQGTKLVIILNTSIIRATLASISGVVEAVFTTETIDGSGFDYPTGQRTVVIDDQTVIVDDTESGVHTTTTTITPISASKQVGVLWDGEVEVPIVLTRSISGNGLAVIDITQRQFDGVGTTRWHQTTDTTSTSVYVETLTWLDRVEEVSRIEYANVYAAFIDTEIYDQYAGSSGITNTNNSRWYTRSFAVNANGRVELSSVADYRWFSETVTASTFEGPIVLTSTSVTDRSISGTFGRRLVLDEVEQYNTSATYARDPVADGITAVNPPQPMDTYDPNIAHDTNKEDTQTVSDWPIDLIIVDETTGFDPADHRFRFNTANAGTYDTSNQCLGGETASVGSPGGAAKWDQWAAPYGGPVLFRGGATMYPADGLSVTSAQNVDSVTLDFYRPSTNGVVELYPFYLTGVTDPRAYLYLSGTAVVDTDVEDLSII